MQRILFVVVGSMIMGAGIGIAVASGLGADPLAILWEGVCKVTGLSLGESNVVVALIMAIPLLLFDRSQIGPGTILSPLLVGFMTDFVLGLSIPISSIVIRVIMMIGGLALLAIGAAIYASANIGRSTYDGCLFIIHSYFGFSIAKIRSCADFLLLVFGVLLGGSISIGPFVAIIIVGPILGKVLSYIQSRHYFTER